jgi:hypothetical protein
MIQTQAGTLQLGSTVNLPPGTRVTLEVISQSAPQAGSAGATAPPTAAGTLPFAAGAAPWTALTEALQVLQRSDPQAAQLLANTIPDGGRRTADGGPRTVAADGGPWRRTADRGGCPVFYSIHAQWGSPSVAR